MNNQTAVETFIAGWKNNEEIEKEFAAALETDCILVKKEIYMLMAALCRYRDPEDDEETGHGLVISTLKSYASQFGRKNEHELLKEDLNHPNAICFKAPRDDFLVPKDSFWVPKDSFLVSKDAFWVPKDAFGVPKGAVWASFGTLGHFDRIFGTR